MTQSTGAETTVGAVGAYPGCCPRSVSSYKLSWKPPALTVVICETDVLRPTVPGVRNE